MASHIKRGGRRKLQFCLFAFTLAGKFLYAEAAGGGGSSLPSETNIFGLPSKLNTSYSPGILEAFSTRLALLRYSALCAENLPLGFTVYDSHCWDTQTLSGKLI